MYKVDVSWNLNLFLHGFYSTVKQTLKLIKGHMKDVNFLFKRKITRA